MIYVVGDTHGKIRDMYDAIPPKATTIISVGDFGIWPDPEQADTKTKEKQSTGDFPQIWKERGSVPVRTYFCKGNHEDFEFLSKPPAGNEILPGLHYCPNGTLQRIEDLTFGFLGGSYASSQFLKPSGKAEGGRRRHFYADEFETLIALGPVDYLVMHDSMNREGEPYHPDLIMKTGAKVVFSGHQHVHRDDTKCGVRFVQLAMIGRPGWCVGIGGDSQLEIL